MIFSLGLMPSSILCPSRATTVEFECLLLKLRVRVQEVTQGITSMANMALIWHKANVGLIPCTPYVPHAPLGITHHWVWPPCKKYISPVHYKTVTHFFMIIRIKHLYQQDPSFQVWRVIARAPNAQQFSNLLLIPWGSLFTLRPKSFRPLEPTGAEMTRKYKFPKWSLRQLSDTGAGYHKPSPKNSTGGLPFSGLLPMARGLESKISPLFTAFCKSNNSYRRKTARGRGEKEEKALYLNIVTKKFSLGWEVLRSAPLATFKKCNQIFTYNHQAIHYISDLVVLWLEVCYK